MPRQMPGRTGGGVNVIGVSPSKLGIELVDTRTSRSIVAARGVLAAEGCCAHEWNGGQHRLPTLLRGPSEVYQPKSADSTRRSCRMVPDPTGLVDGASPP